MLKVLIINGSPHENGSTARALREVAETLNSEGVETENFWIGNDPIAGCTGCLGCGKTHRCVVDDVVNRALDMAENADGYIIGSPVHYAGIAGNLKPFLDRFFWAGSHELKPGAAVAVARRAGTTATLDGLNKYFTISQMPVVSSCYWNMAHGYTADEVPEDEEGMQVMRVLGRNMAWLLKCIAAGRRDGVALPEKEKQARTNFIR